MTSILPLTREVINFQAYPGSPHKKQIALCAVASALFLFALYHYIIGVHNVGDLSQLAQATSALMLPTVNERCRLAGPKEYKCLANVMFIGASKCGTTSLANHLGFHPGVEFIQRRMDIKVRRPIFQKSVFKLHQSAGRTRNPPV